MPARRPATILPGLSARSSRARAAGGRLLPLLALPLLAACGAAAGLVPGGGLAKAAIDAAGPSGAPGGAPLVAGDLSVVQHPDSGPLVAAARIEGDLSIEHSAAGAGAPPTEEELAERAKAQEIEVLRRLLEERTGAGDEDG